MHATWERRLHEYGPCVFIVATAATFAWRWYLSFRYPCDPDIDVCFRVVPYRVVTASALIAGVVGLRVLRPVTPWWTIARWIVAIAPLAGTTLFGLFAPDAWLYEY